MQTILLVAGCDRLAIMKWQLTPFVAPFVVLLCCVGSNGNTSEKGKLLRLWTVIREKESTYVSVWNSNDIYIYVYEEAFRKSISIWKHKNKMCHSDNNISDSKRLWKCLLLWMIISEVKIYARITFYYTFLRFLTL